ncbi:hypothetical protein DKX38_026678 [Salix brachista]|uniref:Uncharacterized protein n=1 Tax=Salix brachista TaxID=2182728 RepID=A0A5N5JE68_9ROSI|nr:hypothetical protein DKX38_026678 [Salix brachista]
MLWRLSLIILAAVMLALAFLGFCKCYFLGLENENEKFEPDMLAFSGCYFGGGGKERMELGKIRRRMLLFAFGTDSQDWFPSTGESAFCSARGLARKKQIGKEAVVKIIDDAYRQVTLTKNEGRENALSHQRKLVLC